MKNYKQLESINVSSMPGQPSTFWKSETGYYYTTKAAAARDNCLEAVKPEDYAIRKSFFNRHKKTIITALAAVAAIAICYAVKSGKIQIKR